MTKAEAVMQQLSNIAVMEAIQTGLVFILVAVLVATAIADYRDEKRARQELLDENRVHAVPGIYDSENAPEVVPNPLYGHMDDERR